MENINKWKAAATDGLILSAVTIIYSLLSNLLSGGGIAIKFLSLILWAVKFGACLWLIHYLMKKYSANFETISYIDSFKYGLIIVFFSSVLCSCWEYFNIAVINPETTSEAIEAVGALVGTSISQEQFDAIMPMLDNLAIWTLFSTLVYYFLFGLVVVAITAKYTKKENIFNDPNIQA